MRSIWQTIKTKAIDFLDGHGTKRMNELKRFEREHQAAIRAAFSGFDDDEITLRAMPEELALWHKQHAQAREQFFEEKQMSRGMGVEF